MPANFRTYEAQARLLTAVVAAHPELKLNYKAIAQHYGSDWGTSGIEHFFRPIKKNAPQIRKMVEHIATYFGDSTPDGIQFQFRQIKQDAKALRQGKSISTPTSTPRATRVAPANTPKSTAGRKRAAVSAPSTGKSSVSKKLRENVNKLAENPDAAKADLIDSEDDNQWPPLELTPTKSNVDPVAMARYENSIGLKYPPDTNAPELAQGASPDEDDDSGREVTTPADAAPAYSFAQNAQSSSTGADDWSVWGNTPFGMGQPNLSGALGRKKYALDDDFEDEAV